MRWLEKEALGKQVGLYIIGCLLLKLFFVFFVLCTVRLLEIEIPPVNRKEMPIFTFSFPIIFLGSVITEEILFRLPLAIFLEKKWSIPGVLAAAFVLSVIFGILHGSVYHIFIQGIAGFIYSILFLKCGGLQRKYFKAINTTITAHLSWNTILVGIAIATGATLF